jgi:hypothetical protein
MAGNLQAISINTQKVIPSYLEGMAATGMISDYLRQQLMEHYEADIRRAEERGRMEACDIMEEAMTGMKKGNKKCSHSKTI